MKIGFLANGSPDCPLIGIYDFDHNVACQLHDVIFSLVDLKTECVAFHDLPFVQAVDDCRVTGELGNRDEGLFIDSKNRNSFVWKLAEEGWVEVAGLIEPFWGNGAGGWGQNVRVAEIKARNDSPFLYCQPESVWRFYLPMLQ